MYHTSSMPSIPSRRNTTIVFSASRILHMVTEPRKKKRESNKGIIYNNDSVEASSPNRSATSTATNRLMSFHMVFTTGMSFHMVFTTVEDLRLAVGEEEQFVNNDTTETTPPQPASDRTKLTMNNAQAESSSGGHIRYTPRRSRGINEVTDEEPVPKAQRGEPPHPEGSVSFAAG
ncbi:hypothetical protein BX600DRAFT_443420 [Xylariales sp. PMI_506]|nr:hypothetical protein BX600DRAFT_443420 [Xylariales sp. PMI_506]